jgi:hypothetical protein
MAKIASCGQLAFRPGRVVTSVLRVPVDLVVPGAECLNSSLEASATEYADKARRSVIFPSSDQMLFSRFFERLVFYISHCYQNFWVPR